MKKSFLLLLVSMLMPVIASAQVYAYIIDNDGANTNIREAPGGKVVYQLPTDQSFVVELLKFKGNWWKISEVVSREGDDPAEITLTGSKKGYWIHNSLLQFTVAGDPTGFLHTRPSKNARRIILDDSTELELRPLEKNGQWVKVVTTNGRYTGWMHSDKICYNPLTTCP